MTAPTDHTTYNTENAALVLIDHQIGTIGWAGELRSQEERDQVKMWTLLVSRFAKAAGMPVILTSGQEDQAQGPLWPEFQEILPEAYEARVRRGGIINAWDDPDFQTAVRAAGRRKLLVGGITTDVCLVPPALSAKADGFDVVALSDISAATSGTSAQNSRDLLQAAGIPLLTTLPMISSMLEDYTVPAAAGLFEGMAAQGVYEAFARGDLR